MSDDKNYEVQAIVNPKHYVIDFEKIHGRAMNFDKVNDILAILEAWQFHVYDDGTERFEILHKRELLKEVDDG